MGWFSCFEPRKPVPPTISRSAISRPLEASKLSKRFHYPPGRTEEGLRQWKEANDRRVAEERRAEELELQTYLRGRDERRQRSGVELSPGRYDSSSSRQQREPANKSTCRPMSGVDHYLPYYDDRRRQKMISGVDHYPPFEEILQHERQAPRGKDERNDRSKDNQQRRPNSGIEHYAPMEVIDEHERPNPLALDSRYVVALNQFEGRADSKAGRSRSQKHKPDPSRRRPADPWVPDGGLARPKYSGSPTR